MMISLKPKRTLFFYFGIAAIVLLVGMLVYHVVSYNQTIQSYIDNGYDRATVVAYMPFLTTVLPSWSTMITTYGIVASILFSTDAILIALRGNKIQSEEVVEEIFIEQPAKAKAPKKASKPKEKKEAPAEDDKQAKE